MSGNQRTVHWWESQLDAGLIQKNGWNFNIAQTVTDSNGKATSNVIWQSAGLAPMVNLTWKVEYALNWCATLPPSGVSVSVGGVWQACAPGESYDLDSNGFWQPSANGGKPSWLSVGNVGYQYPGLSGIHLMVGVKNAATGGWDTIYVDTTVMPLQSSASYQPQEPVSWWLGGSTESGSMYTSTRGAVDTKPNGILQPSTGKYELWTTYVFASGSWVDTSVAPPQKLVAASSRHAEFLPLFRKVIFNIPVEAGLQSLTSVYVKAYLQKWYVTATVKWTTPRNMSVEFGPLKPGANAADILSQYLATGDEDARLNNGLISARSENDLPPTETWNIVPSTQADFEERDPEEGEDISHQLAPQSVRQQPMHQAPPTDFAAQRASKLANINNPINAANGIEPSYRAISGSQPLGVY